MSKPKSKYISPLSNEALEEIKLYIEASVEIYGIISVSKLAEIINYQNAEMKHRFGKIEAILTTSWSRWVM